MSLLITRGLGRANTFIKEEVIKIKNIYQLPIFAEVEISGIAADIEFSKEAFVDTQIRFTKS